MLFPDAQRQTASSMFSRGREAGTRFCAVPPHLPNPPPLSTTTLVFLLLITVISQLATLAGERTTSSRFRYVTQRVCSHARCTLVVSHLLPPGRVASLAEDLGVTVKPIAALSFGMNSKKGQCTFLQYLLFVCNYSSSWRNWIGLNHSWGKQIVPRLATHMCLNRMFDINFEYDLKKIKIKAFSGGYKKKGLAKVSLTWCIFIAWSLWSLTQRKMCCGQFVKCCTSILSSANIKSFKLFIS